MKLTDIIKKESDRIFIVDPGCFIIFTGNSLEDSQPFIRIGNWHDMPVDLIPLIENIIVTDSLTGNPALEQFNININYQSSNRYIGSHYTLRKFLDYQKIFGLDLKNVTVVDVENDIPEINSRTISDREAFIGIFYKNGNFKITHNEKDLFDLHKIQSSTCHTKKILDYLYENCRGKNHFWAQGFVVSDNSLIVYNENNFYLSNFPQQYRALFNRLGLNPKKIDTIAQHSANYISLTEFISWVNTCEAKCTLLSDDKAALSVMKRLFSSAQLQIRPLTGAESTIGQDVSVKELNGSTNKVVSYKTESGSTVQCLFVSHTENVMKYIKKDISAVFVPASLYEECTLLLKSSGIPACVMEDGNKAFSKISSLSEIPLYKEIVYNVRPFASTNECLNYFSAINEADELIQLFASDQKECKNRIEEYLNSDVSIFRKINYLSLIRYLKNITSDRRLSSQFSRVIQTYGLQYCVENLVAMNIPFYVELLIADNGIFPVYFAKKRDENAEYFLPDDTVLYPPEEGQYKNAAESQTAAERIDTDRKRLLQLVSLYTQSGGEREGINNLKKSITSRKSLYHSSYILKEDVESINEKTTLADTTAETKNKMQQLLAFLRYSVFDTLIFDRLQYKKLTNRRELLERDTDNSEMPEDMPVKHPSLLDYIVLSRPSIIIRSLRPAVIILLLLLLGALFLTQLRPFRDDPAAQAGVETSGSAADESSAVIEESGADTADTDTAAEESEPADKDVLEERVSGTENSEIIDAYNISISDTQILKYANSIAVLNGYHPIQITDVNGKNPHWIYPGNVFELPDGESFVVRAGDSLWKIAELKLTRMSIEFYQAVEKIQAAAERSEGRPDELFEKAEDVAFSTEYKKTLNELDSLFQ